jgi:hypothetical protein
MSSGVKRMSHPPGTRIGFAFCAAQYGRNQQQANFAISKPKITGIHQDLNAVLATDYVAAFCSDKRFAHEDTRFRRLW